MAKEFKNYDKLFAKDKGTAFWQLPLEYRQKRDPQGAVIKSITCWTSLCHSYDKMAHFTEAYSHDQIRAATYEHPNSEHWQKFRVGLKGLATREKLWCLLMYRTWMCNAQPMWEDTIHIMVNNYLGALKRGGQLATDEFLTVQK